MSSSKKETPDGTTKKRVNRLTIFAFLLMLGVFIIGGFVGFRQVQPPSPPAESSTNYQVYQDMLANLQIMASKPHVPGSPELEAVRSHILAQIKDMGLEPTVESITLTAADIQTHTKQYQDQAAPPNSTAPPPGGPNGPHRNTGEPEDPAHPEVVYDDKGKVTLKNILVKLDAPNTDSGILMMAHYDSENVSPGAADDMVSVTALLEAMRKQSKNADLKNDLYFLLTDGEELQAIGTKYFVAAHPELKDSIALVVNLEARGTRGGLIMFETSAQNYDVMRYLKSALSTPMAFGFTAELYRHLPNGTDLTNFLQAGYNGLNFAVAEGVEHYHEPTDNFQNLNRSSAYQFLLTALEMSDYAASTQLRENAKQDSVYFPFWPGNLVLVTKFFAYIVSGFAVVLGAAWLAVQLRRKQVQFKQLAVSSAWLLGIIAATGLLSWATVSLLTKILNIEDSTNTVPIFLIQSTLLGVAVLAVCSLRMRKLTLDQAIAGLLPVQLLLVIASTIFLYSASYLFVLPTFALLTVAVLERSTLARFTASTIFGIGILLLYVPVCWLLYVVFMLPGAPLAVGLGVIPIAIITAFFMANPRSGRS